LAYNKEVERKFLVNKDKLPPIEELDNCNRILQFYLSFEPEVRVVNRNYEKAEITIKSNDLEARDEFSYLIPVEEADRLLSLKRGLVIEKTRLYFRIQKGMLQGYVWEVDIYRGANKGLVVAEIECNLPSLMGCLDRELPEFIVREVTMDRRFKNSSLAQNPWSSDWPDTPK
jgi:adenylate cyclase